MKIISAQNFPVLPIQVTRPTSQDATDSRLSYVLYDPVTGRIDHAGFCAPHSMPMVAKAGCLCLQAHADPLMDYVDLSGSEPAIKPRPVISSLSSLPIHSTVTVFCHTTQAQTTYEADDGSFEYCDLPGRYRITVESWPHHTAYFEVELPQ